MVLLKPRRIWLLFWLGSVQVYRSSSQMVLWFFLFKICSNKAFWITSFPLISSSSIDRFNPPWPSWVVKTTLTWFQVRTSWSSSVLFPADVGSIQTRLKLKDSGLRPGFWGSFLFPPQCFMLWRRLVDQSGTWTRVGRGPERDVMSPSGSTCIFKHRSQFRDLNKVVLKINMTSLFKQEVKTSEI